MDNLKKEIQRLKKEKNAVILAHYYVNEEIQMVADYVGDSYYLAKAAKQTDAEIIVFCGVSFMGESAKILNPEKTVLMPDLDADCPMAHMAAINRIEKLRKEYEDLAVVCYINSTAQLKCHSDICVTSSNAVNIVKKLPNKHIFFIPDENLGRYVAEQVPEKHIIINDGYCPIHKEITAQAIKSEKEKHPNAKVLVHPECTLGVLELADYIGSTADLIRYAKDSVEQEFIIGTECGVLYELKKNNPEKQFYFPEEKPCCSGMKKNTLEKICRVLASGENTVELSDELREKSLIPLERMLQMAK